MPSTTSLDQDMRNLRMSRYTPAVANEARSWIENVLGRSLASGDLLDALKDGVALCEMVNLVLPSPGIKFKSSNMPFVQMENISHFLRACEMPPLNMPAHDRFLTVDLYEGKDPAQVMQCLATFSRQANAINPTRFPTCIGPRKLLSPTATGRNETSPTRRALSPSLTGGSTGSQNSTRSPPPISSWSNKADVGSTAPAWSIHQYGWTGGADQGKQGISFGARRQITSQAPVVPSLAEKERQRKEAERERRIQEEDDARKKVEAEREERLAREAEELKWEEETRRHREEERARLAAQKKEWEDQERQWQEAEKKREAEHIQPVKKPPPKPRTPSGNILRGQTLSEYQREQASQPTETPDQIRVRELERQLAEAREREKQYQAERQQRPVDDRPSSQQSDEVSWIADDRENLRRQGVSVQLHDAPVKLDSTRAPIPVRTSVPEAVPNSVEPTHVPTSTAQSIPVKTSIAGPALTETTLPDSPETLPTQTTPTPVQTASDTSRARTIRSPFARPANRTDNYLSSNPAPIATPPRISSSTEAGDTAQEQAKIQDDRVASQQKTRAGAWASKSLLEREMERERERQREWESNQANTKNTPRDTSQGVGEGQTWDVNTYGWVKGDSQNKGSSSGSGINVGGRRQIIGPRPQP